MLACMEYMYVYVKNLQISHIGARIDDSQCSVNLKRIRQCGAFKTLTQYDLKYIPCLDVLFCLFHTLLVFFPCHV